jgi:hypothetical protein
VLQRGFVLEDFDVEEGPEGEEGNSSENDPQLSEPAAKRRRGEPRSTTVTDYQGKQIDLPKRPKKRTFWVTYQWWFSCKIAEFSPPFESPKWQRCEFNDLS